MNDCSTNAFMPPERQVEVIFHMSDGTTRPHTFNAGDATVSHVEIDGKQFLADIRIESDGKFGITAIYDWNGERYERVRECENASRYAGEFKCSECGAEWKTEDMDLVEPTLWIDGVADYPSYCQHCGARVRGGGE